MTETKLFVAASCALVASLFCLDGLTWGGQSICDQWPRPASECEVTWKHVRDSRFDASLGLRPSERDILGKAWIANEIARADTVGVASLGGDGRLHPQNRDPFAMRREFRYLLFNDRIGPWHPVPEAETLTILLKSDSLATQSRLGALVEFSAIAPVLAFHPGLLCRNADDSVVLDRAAHHRGESLAVFSFESHPLGKLEAWVDPSSSGLIKRLFCWRDERLYAQVDIEYQADQPQGWTVMEFAADGYVIDFVQTVVTDHKQVRYHESGVFELAVPSGRLHSPQRLGYQMGRDVAGRLRAAWWLLLACASLLGGSVVLRKRFRLGKHAVTLCLFLTVFVGVIQHVPLACIQLREAHDEVALIAGTTGIPVGGMATQGDEIAGDEASRLIYIVTLLQQRQQLYHFWGILFGRDAATEKAVVDLIQLANNDLPSLLRNPLEIRARQSLVIERLGKVDEHLINPYFSPYSVPVALGHSIDDYEPEPRGWSPTTAWIVFASTAFIFGVLAWRQKARRVAVKPDAT